MPRHSGTTYIRFTSATPGSSVRRPATPTSVPVASSCATNRALAGSAYSSSESRRVETSVGESSMPKVSWSSRKAAVM